MGERYVNMNTHVRSFTLTDNIYTLTMTSGLTQFAIINHQSGSLHNPYNKKNKPVFQALESKFVALATGKSPNPNLVTTLNPNPNV